MKKWVYQNGWSRDILGDKSSSDPFPGGTRTFAELEENGDYFMKQEVQSRQMNFQQLQTYIAELEQSGFNTRSLNVDLQGKFSKPLFALILATVSIPFAFLAGNRGAMSRIRDQAYSFSLHTGESRICSRWWATWAS